MYAITSFPELMLTINDWLLQPTYNRGYTTVHEVGHWLGESYSCACKASLPQLGYLQACIIPFGVAAKEMVIWYQTR